MDLLDSPSPPTPSSPQLDDVLATLNHSNSHPMKLTGNTLVPAGQSSTSSSPTALTCPPDHCRPTRTTRGTAIAVEQQKVDADGHANKRTRLGVELAVNGEGFVRRASTRSQTQPDGTTLSLPGATGHAKRRCHTTLHGHTTQPSTAVATLRYMG